MFCTKCGAVVDEKTGVCPNCGACERAEEKAEKPDSKKKLHLGKATYNLQEKDHGEKVVQRYKRL